MKDAYKKYLNYICMHKRNVFIECIKMSKLYKGKDRLNLIIHAFTHDLDKLNPKIFIPYANWFYGYHGINLTKIYNEEQITNGESCLSRNFLECKNEFKKARELHYMNNIHHWKYWCEYDDNNNIINCKEMSIYALRQMICDWSAMSIKFDNTIKEYYLKNYNKIKLHENSRKYIETYLGI